MVQPGQNLSPWRPDRQPPILDDLIGLIDAGDQLGEVAGDEHHHYGGEESGHGGVSAVVGRDRVVEAVGTGMEIKVTKKLNKKR